MSGLTEGARAVGPVKTVIASVFATLTVSPHASRTVFAQRIKLGLEPSVRLREKGEVITIIKASNAQHEQPG